MTFSFRALTTSATAAAALMVAAALAPTTASAAVPHAAAAAAAAADCTGDLKVDQTLPNGARWQLCWDIDADQGLLTKRVRYTPKGSGTIDVLQHLSLAQIHVPYDAGDDIRDMPMGEGSEVLLTPKDCPGGRLLKRRPTDTKAYVCLRTLDRGHGYKQGSGDGDDGKQRQSKELVLNAVFSVGWYNYIIEYRFGDEGDITPRLGATGSLAETGENKSYLDARKGPKYGWAVLPGYTKFAESHSHNAYWRMDFGMQGTTGNRVEQFDFTGGGTAKREMKRVVLQKESAATLSGMRFWRVFAPGKKNADGHPISWQLGGEVASTQYRGPAKFTHADVYVTQWKGCEKLAVDTDAPRGCKASVDQYVNGETLTHPVVWLDVGFHHVPRDEDQDPMPSHWQGFTMAPRDATAKNPY